MAEEEIIIIKIFFTFLCGQIVYQTFGFRFDLKILLQLLEKFLFSLLGKILCQ